MTKEEVDAVTNAIQSAVLAALQDLHRRFGEKSPFPALPFSKEEKLNDTLILVSRAAGHAAAAQLQSVRGP